MASALECSCLNRFHASDFEWTSDSGRQESVVERLRATGPGWQTRVDTALRQWIETQPKRRRA
ncbi:MAG: BrnA antitoxin family protein [Acidobacteriaceae bacterium]